MRHTKQIVIAYANQMTTARYRKSHEMSLDYFLDFLLYAHIYTLC